MLELNDVGYPFDPDKVVCSRCIEDGALCEVLRATPEELRCDFCGSKRGLRGPLRLVIRRIAQALALDWSQPEDELFHDRESDTGYAGEVRDARDVLDDILELTSADLMDAIVMAFDDRLFCEREYGIMRPTERLHAGWERFKHAVKHERRFTFWSMGDQENELSHPDYLPVGEMLDEIATIVQKAKLLRQIPKGTAFWRVRLHDTGSRCKEDHELSAPPSHLAVQSNRMSPSGVSMFYGAEHFTTAWLETVDPIADSAKSVSGGKFHTVRDLTLLDIVDLPELPSYFDLKKRDHRLAILFLRGFAKDLTAPIGRDGHEHIEYVPTQAFTEYVRFRMRSETDHSVDGIRYRSSRAGKACIVLFCGQEECLDRPRDPRTKPWLSLDRAFVRTKSVKSLMKSKATR